MIPSQNDNRGFTLIELILVVAIIGVLASIILPKFADMLDRAKIAALKGHLGALRSAMALYYADNEGLMPDYSPGVSTDFLQTNLTPRYIEKIPTVRWPRIYIPFTTNTVAHPENSILFSAGCSDVNITFPFNDPYCYRGWAGAGDRGSADRLTLTCRFHLDSRGTYFSSY